MATPLLCLESGCKYSRKENKDSETIRCISCMNWFHVKCVNETHPETIHTCLSCRNVPLYTKNIMLSMTTLIERIGKLDKGILDLKNNHETLTKQFADMQKESESAKADNSVLRKEILTLRAELSKANWPLQPSDTESKPSLILGSSVLRDIDNNRIQNAFVHSISGGKIKDAISYVDDVPAGKYSSITLVIGGNDCDDPSSSPADVVKTYTDLIGKAQQKSTNVIIGSILPRHCPDDPNVSQRIDTVNAEIQVVCNDTNCKYVENNTSFKLLDGSLNDGYYLHERNTTKLVHLNDRGTSKLCDLLNIKAKDTKVTKDRPRNRPQHQTQGRNLPITENDARQIPTQPPQWARNNPASRDPPPQRTQPDNFPERRSPPQTNFPRWARDKAPASRPPPRHTQLPSPGHAQRPSQEAPQSLPRPWPQYSPPASQFAHPRPESDRAPFSQHRPRANTPPHDPQYSPPRHAQYFDTYFDPRCENCAEKGHSTEDCWYSEILQCTNCYHMGHKRKDCPYLTSHRPSPTWDSRDFSY